jgi:hypothetical protein
MKLKTTVLKREEDKNLDSNQRKKALKESVQVPALYLSLLHL